MTGIIGADALGATVVGYPRIGPDRELKRAVERYWAGSLDQAGLRRDLDRVAGRRAGFGAR